MCVHTASQYFRSFFVQGLLAKDSVASIKPRKETCCTDTFLLLDPWDAGDEVWPRRDVYHEASVAPWQVDFGQTCFLRQATSKKYNAASYNSCTLWGAVRPGARGMVLKKLDTYPDLIHERMEINGNDV